METTSTGRAHHSVHAAPVGIPPTRRAEDCPPRHCRLQNDWARLDFVGGCENALRMERLTAEITLARDGRSHSKFEQRFEFWNGLRLSRQKETFFHKFKIETEVFMWRYWWSHRDALRALKGCEVLLDAARFVETNHSIKVALHQQAVHLQVLGIIHTNNATSVMSDAMVSLTMVDLHSMMSRGVRALSGALRAVMRVEARKQLVITAIALKRYQLKHGGLPRDLNSLVPEFLSSVPLDPVNGRPLHYRRKAAGTFLLYSVGENGRDDGGNPSPKERAESANGYYWPNPDDLDWVWPQPATPEEIRAYHARQKSDN